MKKIGTKTYPNGTKYKGEIDKEGHPHGKGTMIFPKQFTYIHKGKKYISNVLISSWGKKKYVGQFFCSSRTRNSLKKDHMNFPTKI